MTTENNHYVNVAQEKEAEDYSKYERYPNPAYRRRLRIEINEMRERKEKKEKKEKQKTDCKKMTKVRDYKKVTFLDGIDWTCSLDSDRVRTRSEHKRYKEEMNIHEDTLRGLEDKGHILRYSETDIHRTVVLCKFEDS